MVSQLQKMNTPKLLFFILIFVCAKANLNAQVPQCDPGTLNTLVQVDNSTIYVDVNSNNCKLFPPYLVGRWTATAGPGFELIDLSQAPSSSYQLTLNGGAVCPEGEIEVIITALFFYLGDPIDPGDDILCSVLGYDVFIVEENTPPSFMNLTNMTINVTNDCDISAPDVKALLKNSHVKDNCTDKTYLVANSWVSRCDMNEPADPECPNVVQCWTYHIIDACGNEAEQDVTITVTETIPPVIKLPASFTINANSDCLITDAQLLALVNASHVSDNCTSDATLLANLWVEDASGQGCPIYFPETPRVTCPYNPQKWCVTYYTEDACGNQSVGEDVNIYVKDVTAPVLTAPADFTVCWPDPNYPFQNFTLEPAIEENCDKDCDITCHIYSQRILSLTNPARGAYGNNVYPTLNISPGPRVAKVRVCAQDLCGNGALNPALNAPLPSNCCTFNITLVYDEGCMPPLAKVDQGIESKGNFESQLTETGHTEVEYDEDLYLGAFPNPVADQAQVYFNLPENSSYELKLVSYDGKTLFSRKENGLQGRNVVPVRRSEFGGMPYVFCTVSTAKTQQTIILIGTN